MPIPIDEATNLYLFKVLARAEARQGGQQCRGSIAAAGAAFGLLLPSARWLHVLGTDLLRLDDWVDRILGAFNLVSRLEDPLIIA